MIDVYLPLQGGERGPVGSEDPGEEINTESEDVWRPDLSSRRPPLEYTGVISGSHSTLIFG